MNDSKKPLILCIDDDSTILKLTERFISNGGYDVITAENGPKGIELALSAKPNLILLDIMMPGMDGYEVCSRLQKNNDTAYIPVIFVTALGEAQTKARAFSVGAVDYLVKPISRDRLIGKIEEHIKTDKAWKAIHKVSESWHEKLLSANFLQFKEFLFRQLKVDPEEKFKISSVSPSNIFQAASQLGISRASMAHYIAEFMDIPYISEINPRSVALGVLPTAFCKSNNVVTITDENNETAFVLSNPFDWDLVDMLRRFSGVSQSAKILITEPMNIGVIFEPYIGKQVESDLPLQKEAKSDVHVIDEDIESLDMQLKGKPTVQITTMLIAMSVSKRASDIHIEPKENNTVIRFRIDGDLKDIATLEKITGPRLLQD